MKIQKKSRRAGKSKTKKRVPPSLGSVTHYFGKIDVAVIKIKSALKVGDYIKFKTSNGEFVQLVDSIQINHKNIMGARKGSEIGLKVIQPVKEGDIVLKAEKPKPIVVEEKVVYQPLFPRQPEQKPLPPPPPPPPVSRSEPSAPRPAKTPSRYSEIKFLKF